jgi:hypothetical protein
MMFCIYASHGQEVPGEEVLRINSMAFGDSIRVMWMPGNEELWKKGISRGYKLSRTTIKRNGSFLQDDDQEMSRKVLGEYYCMTYDTWMATIDTTDQWEILAAGMVYGELEEVVPNGPLDLSSFLDKEAASANQYAFNLLAINHSFTAAEKMGLAFTDKDVDPGAAYLYTIEMVDIPEIYDNDIVLNERVDIEPVSVLEINIIEKGLAITWPIRYLESIYISYDIERSVAGTNNYQLVNSSPIMQAEGQMEMFYLDNTVEEGINYQYRVRGRTPFGTNGGYTISDQVKYLPRVIVKAPVLTTIDFSADTIYCHWAYEGELADELQFNVYFSPNHDGPYNRLNTDGLSIDDKPFISTQVLPSGYFYVEAIHGNGESMSSVKRMYNPEDITPPAIPEGLSCAVDTMKSEIIVTWTENEELDLLGYRLFMANQEDGHYLEMLPGVIVETACRFPISATTNGEKMWYKVASVDARTNNSAMSESCKVILPDRTPPAAPLIRKVNNGDSSIVLEWAISPSYDILKHRIERRGEKEGEWKSLAETTDQEEIQFYEDINLENGLKHFYRIIAIDAGGNETSSIFRVGRLNDKKWKIDIEDWKVELKDGNAILSWSYLSPELLDRIIIYRRTGDRDMISYKIIRAEDLKVGLNTSDKVTCQWVDKGLKADKYAYAIRAVWKDGGTSRKTEEKALVHK